MAIDEKLVDLSLENHELRHHQGKDGEIEALRAELLGLRAELAAHVESDAHHGHLEEEFEEALGPIEIEEKL